MAYMRGNEYWPDMGESVTGLLPDICRVARERGGIILCHNTQRITVTRNDTPATVLVKLGFK